MKINYYSPHPKKISQKHNNKQVVGINTHNQNTQIFGDLLMLLYNKQESTLKSGRSNDEFPWA